MDYYLIKQKILRRYFLKYGVGFIGATSLSVLSSGFRTPNNKEEKNCMTTRLSEKALKFLKGCGSEVHPSSISPISINIIEALVKEPHMLTIENKGDFKTAELLCTFKDGKDEIVVKMFTNPKGVDHIFLADSQGKMIFGSYAFDWESMKNHNKELKEAIALIASQNLEINLYRAC